jgi:hypothetical protein
VLYPIQAKGQTCLYQLALLETPSFPSLPSSPHSLLIPISYLLSPLSLLYLSSISPLSLLSSFPLLHTSMYHRFVEPLKYSLYTFPTLSKEGELLKVPQRLLLLRPCWNYMCGPSKKPKKKITKIVTQNNKFQKLQIKGTW